MEKDASSTKAKPEVAAEEEAATVEDSVISIRAPEEENFENNNASNADSVKQLTECNKQEEPITIDITNTEKFDELSSLEREIAEMHHVEPTEGDALLAENVNDEKELHQSERSVSSSDFTKNKSGYSTPAQQSIRDVNSPGSITITGDEHKISNERDIDAEDLIAVLKGIDTSTGTDGPHDQETTTTATELDMAEGEGVTIEGEGQFEIMEIDDDDDGEEDVVPVPHQSNKKLKVKMSLSEERALAMEQMANLNSKSRNQAKSQTKIKSRRKQEIKPTDIVSSITADWSDDESTLEAGVSGLNKAQKSKTIKSKKAMADNKPQVTSVVLLQPADDKNKDNTDVDANSSTGATGFRRTRIIKRKIIWDPDAPETQKSYSQYATAKSKTTTVASPLPEVTSAAATTIKTTPMTPTVRKEPVLKKLRPTTPKDKKSAAGQTIGEEKSSRSPVISVLSTLQSAKTQVAKRRSQTPSSGSSITNGSTTGNKKKKISEVDRLMGDEGAANMLSELENERIKAGGGVSNEAQKKTMMRSRSATISGKPIKREVSPIKISTTPTTTTTAAVATVAVSKNNAPSTPKNKRATPAAKTRPSAAWDYFYENQKQQANDDSMIIRRRSNSSYSSTASLHRLSIDGGLPGNKSANTSITDDSFSASSTADDGSLNISAKSMGKSSFEFARPESKTTNRQTAVVRRTKSPAANTFTTDMKRAIRTNDNNDKSNRDIPAITTDVFMKKFNKVAQIIISTQRSKVDYTFNVQLLTRLIEMLNKLAKSNDCNTVVITTNAPQFCHGIDFHDLTVGALEKRKISAAQIASVTKNYLRTLCAFPKPLIIGVVGNVKNVGVMQLPLFDFVVSSEKSTFEAPYAKMGQLPEGYCFWNNSIKIQSTIKTKLLLLCDKLTATDVGQSGLINKSVNASKVTEESLAIAKKISETSADTYRMMKKIASNKSLEIMKSLDDEFNNIADLWCTNVCYENFKKYLQTGQF